MKIRVSIKDPDTMPDAVTDALHRMESPSGLSEKEWASIRNERACEIQSEITNRWMAYGEYLLVEFDTDTWTATVLPAKEMK